MSHASSRPPPSTHWTEQVDADEAERFAGYVEIFKALQARKSKKYGPGRALHRKQLAVAQGSLEVLGNLPEFARQGLFAAPGSFELRLRLSNGGMDQASDHQPDIRGLAFKVLGVQGLDSRSALGNGPPVSQDFLLINQEQFAFPRSEEFVAFVQAASNGNGALLRHLFARYGVFGAPLRLARMLKAVGRSFGGFATEPLFSAVPIACGPYAVRVRLQPAAGNGAAAPGAKRDWGADFAQRLAGQDLHWELQLQPFVNEQQTPIEDASVNWDSPYTTVARLHLPRQAASQALALEQEAGVFDPWQALAAHRPLGEVQRARKVVYFASQQQRGAA